MTAKFIRIGRQLLLHRRQLVRICDVGHRLLVVERVEWLVERRERFEQDLAVLAGGDLAGGQRAAVASRVDMKVHRVAGIAGTEVVDVHAVGSAPRRGEACRHQSLGGDMTTGDVVARVVQLRGEEVVIVDTTDVECANDIGQFRPPVTHSANLFIGTGQSGRRQGGCVTSARVT